MAIFTDGSKSVNSVSVGCASVSLNPRNVTSNSIKNIASIFTAECITLIDALDIVLNYTEQNIIILSDSLSVLSCLKNNSNDTKTNLYIYILKQKIQEFAIKTTNNSQIQFYWIPAHAGIRSNEIADHFMAVPLIHYTLSTRLPIGQAFHRFCFPSRQFMFFQGIPENYLSCSIQLPTKYTFFVLYVQVL